MNKMLRSFASVAFIATAAAFSQQPSLGTPAQPAQNATTQSSQTSQAQPSQSSQSSQPETDANSRIFQIGANEVSLIFTVTDGHGRLPGLLLEWRRTVSGWQGRVVRSVLEEGCWVVVEEWLAAECLGPG